MNIKIIAVGRLKKGYIKEGVCDFGRRLSKYVNVETLEVKDERLPDNASEAETAVAKKKEGVRLLSCVPAGGRVVCLDVKGETVSTERFAELIGRIKMDRVKELCFIIGGPNGICYETLARADYRLSLSEMTFPHELARLILMEQLYRAEKLLNGEPYHK